MIKKRFVTSVLSTALILSALPLYTASASSTESDTNLSSSFLTNINNDSELIQNVTESTNPTSRSATGYRYETVSHNTKVISRTYIDTKKYQNKFLAEVIVRVGPATVRLKGSRTLTGQYKRYTVKTKTTVKVKKYQIGNGAYLGTYTYTSNSGYTDTVKK